MKIKPLLIVGLSALLLAGCGKTTTTTTNTTKTNPNSVKLVVNELPLEKRPFVAVVPHSSNHLFSLYVQNADQAKEASVDLEYQSGDLLKGVRTSLESPIKNPYTKAVILGSCSTGGKCSFDGDLKSGTMKLKLDFGDKNLMHVLKGDFTFLQGQSNLPDNKVSFVPTKKTTMGNLILTNSFGFPKNPGKETLLYPITISSVSDKKISGTLTFNVSGVTSVAIFDGTDYQPLKSTIKDGVVTVALDNAPRSIQASIIRDDQKGAVEQTNLYLLGPILLFK